MGYKIDISQPKPRDARTKHDWSQTEQFDPCPRTGPGLAKFKNPGPDKNHQKFETSNRTGPGSEEISGP